MAALEATVEVLTAEVRVLMVGSRQVTLSVYGQLDKVSLSGSFKPFGRVRIKETPRPGEPEMFWERIHLVGAFDGLLVASWFAYDEAKDWYRDPVGIWRNRELAEKTWSELEDLPLIVLAGLR